MWHLGEVYAWRFDRMWHLREESAWRFDCMWHLERCMPGGLIVGGT